MSRTTRFSGADWYSEQQHILMIGVGGIGSWTALNLSRIGHSLVIVDPDVVDETNVHGGQMYRVRDIGVSKSQAIENVCRDFGCVNPIVSVAEHWDSTLGVTPITIMGVDNMSVRREGFETWVKEFGADDKGALFIDGRLTLEMFEVFAIPANDWDRINEYDKKHLFTDAEADELDCTMKQSTFCAMGISAFMTSLLCNHLTNIKLDGEFREVPFYTRMHFPSFQQTTRNVINEQILF